MTYSKTIMDSFPRDYRRFCDQPLKKSPPFSQLQSHKVRLLVIGPSSGIVFPARLPHERWIAGWGSKIRTASGMPDDRSPRVLHIPDAQRRDCSLALAVLRGHRCALIHPVRLWTSILLVDAKGVVRWKSVTTDYRVRPGNAAILKAVDALR